MSRTRGMPEVVRTGHEAIAKARIRRRVGAGPDNEPELAELHRVVAVGVCDDVATGIQRALQTVEDRAAFYGLLRRRKERQRSPLERERLRKMKHADAIT